MTTIIETKKLTRRFGEFTAVDEISLKINSSEIFGLLGPNAAGKSTIIRLLSGILRPSSGEATVLGLDLFKQAELLKSRIGYVAQQFGLYPDLTVSENVAFYGSLYGVNDRIRLREQLDLYDLTAFADKHAGLLSGGYKRRLAIACATMHDPELIFLDEPTAGIDPVTRKELWDFFYTLSTAGKTLFVTTHYMEEAERCNRLAFLNHGKVVAQGSPIEIRASLKNSHVYSCKISHNPALSKALLETEGVQLVNQFGSELRIITKLSIIQQQLHNLISQYHQKPFELIVVEPSIEDAFMSLTSDGERR
jgi:ABC-type multidrug transport system ATPase subunit